MKTNSKGNVMVVENITTNSCQVAIYESATTMKALSLKQNPTDRIFTSEPSILTCRKTPPP
jgi:hypothetical protein